MIPITVVLYLAYFAELMAAVFLGISAYFLSEDTIFMSIYEIFAAFFCLSYALYIRMIHLKEKS